MNYYTSTTEYNCGFKCLGKRREGFAAGKGREADRAGAREPIDLHAHQMYVCLMDRQGKKLVHCNIKDNDFDYFLKLIKPYRHNLTVCCECMLTLSTGP